MARQVINIGTAPSDGSGDPLRISFDKTNQNFAELYASVSSLNTSIFQIPPITSMGKTGDRFGMTAIDDQYIYFCIGAYNGIAHIWQRSAINTTTW